MQMSCNKAFLAGLLAVSYLGAQSETATLSGIVLGPESAKAERLGIQGCQITTVSEATNTKRVVETDEEGRFVIPFLAPGPYKIRVDCQGFPGHPERHLQLAVNDRRNLLFTPGSTGPASQR